MAGVKVVKYLYEVAELSDTVFREIGLDGWVNPRLGRTFVTHAHKDHIPEVEEVVLLVPKKLYEENIRFFEMQPNNVKIAEEEHTPFKIVGTVRHWLCYRYGMQWNRAYVYLFESAEKKILAVGDYDDWNELFEIAKQVQPDIVIIPVYSFSAKRAEDKLYREQKDLLDELKSRRHWIDRGYTPPIVVGCRHSPRAKPIEGLDYFVTENIGMRV